MSLYLPLITLAHLNQLNYPSVKGESDPLLSRSHCSLFSFWLKREGFSVSHVSSETVDITLRAATGKQKHWKATDRLLFWLIGSLGIDVNTKEQFSALGTCAWLIHKGSMPLLFAFSQGVCFSSFLCNWMLSKRNVSLLSSTLYYVLSWFSFLSCSFRQLDC